MAIGTLSSKGQVTLPARVRRALRMKPKSKVEIEVRDDEVVIRPVRSVLEVYGIFHEYSKGKNDDWETVRQLTEEAVAREVMGEDNG